MCTVTWVQQAGRYTLFSNRDEKLSRPLSTAPVLHERNGVRFIAPIDRPFGGSWIACNQAGVAVCLLNGNRGAHGSRSRGRLLIDIAAASSQTDVAARLKSQDLGQYSPFMLLAIEPRAPATLFSWDGQTLCATKNVEPPLASSSFDFDGVRRIRRDQFATLGSPTVETLRDFHSSHNDGPGPYSTCMHRPDARTVSFTEVTVEHSTARMIFQPGSPCEMRPVESLDLRLSL